jgi:endonuclease/exonuclease/phosphatase family metal-dependent hydrolase
MGVSAIQRRGLPHPGTVRVLTYNIYGHSSRWPERRRVLAAGLRALHPDLVAFQETIATGGYDQVTDLLGDDFHVIHSRSRREEDGWGVSIASRWPIGAVRELDLNVTPRTAGFACTTLLAEIRVPDPIGPLLFVNHFPNWQLELEHERELQAVVAARAIEETVAGRDLHVVLVGDLDAEPDAASVRFLTGKQALGGTSVCYRNAWDRAHPGEPGHTFTARNPLVTETNWDWPFQRIDHILVRCGEHGGPTLAIAACELAFDEPIEGVWASDHFALVADLAPPPPVIKVP